MAKAKTTKKTGKSSTSKAPTKRAKGVVTAPKAENEVQPTIQDPKPVEAKSEGKMSLMTAARTILKDSKEPMNTKQIIEEIQKRGIWETKGKTPANTLYTGFLNDMKKGDASTVTKVESGKFTLAK